MQVSFECEIRWSVLTLSISALSFLKQSMVYTKRHRVAPNQSNSEKPPESCLRNLVHSEVCLGGVSWFLPYFCSRCSACSLRKPFFMLVSYFNSTALMVIMCSSIVISFALFPAGPAGPSCSLRPLALAGMTWIGIKMVEIDVKWVTGQRQTNEKNDLAIVDQTSITQHKTSNSIGSFPNWNHHQDDNKCSKLFRDVTEVSS